MRIQQGLVMLVAAQVAMGSVAADPLAERLICESGKIRTMRCDVRRETDLDGKRVTILSRVWFERPDRLRVDTVMPDSRRIVVDGTTIYKWIGGMQEGVAIPLAEAPASELVQVRKTPGTADEHLMRLRGVAGSELPPEDGLPVRRAFTPAEPHPYTILSLDAVERLVRIEFYEAAIRENRLLRTDFEGWREVKPGIWIACVQRTSAKGRDGTAVTETLRVSGIVVNEPVDPANFDVAVQAPGVRFMKPEEMAETLRNSDRD